MLDFSNTMNNHHFALNDVELRILQPVFSQFHAKTGLSIDELSLIHISEPTRPY